MADRISFNVEVRARVGKGGAREARRNGLVPGVLYGGDDAPVPISLRRNEVIKAIETGQFLSSTADLVHDGQRQLVIPQAIQLDPVTDQPIHVDLYRVRSDQTIQVEVPVVFTGEETSPGLKKGGTLNVVRHAVELNVKAGAIPESITADIAALEIGDNVKISDVDLPDGATPTITDRDFTIATIAGRAAAASTSDEDGEAVEADAEEAADGDED